MVKNKNAKEFSDEEQDCTGVDQPSPVSDDSNRLRHFASIAVDLYWETDASLCFTYLSEGYEEVTGVPPQSLLSKSRKELLEKFLDDDICEQHFAVLDQRLPYYDLVYQCRGDDGRLIINGRLIIMRSRGHPYFDNNNVFLGYRGVASDITESRAAQLALKISEERFQAFAEIAADLFWETDEEVRFTYLSDRYEEVTGIPL